VYRHSGKKKSLPAKNFPFPHPAGTVILSALRKILPIFLIPVLLYSALLLAERLTTQELMRTTHPSTQEILCLMWKPRFLRGDGVCSLEVLSPQGRITDTARLGTLPAAFDALQQYGQLGFEGQDVTVSNRQTGTLAHRLTLRDGRLVALD